MNQTNFFKTLELWLSYHPNMDRSLTLTKLRSYKADKLLNRVVLAQDSRIEKHFCLNMGGQVVDVFFASLINSDGEEYAHALQIKPEPFPNLAFHYYENTLTGDTNGGIDEYFWFIIEKQIRIYEHNLELDQQADGLLEVDVDFDNYVIYHTWSPQLNYPFGRNESLQYH